MKSPGTPRMVSIPASWMLEDYQYMGGKRASFDGLPLPQVEAKRYGLHCYTSCTAGDMAGGNRNELEVKSRGTWR